MNGIARSSRLRAKLCSFVGVSGMMNVSTIVYRSANVPKNATVFSNT